MKLKLEEPFVLGPRRLPALRIGQSYLSLESSAWIQGRHRAVTFVVDMDGQQYPDDALAAGEFSSIVQAFSVYLTFLSVAGESQNMKDRTGTGVFTNLFQSSLVQWARDNLSIIQSVRSALSDKHGHVREELITNLEDET